MGWRRAHCLTGLEVCLLEVVEEEREQMVPTVDMDKKWGA
jgi:hypothetical protein